MNGDDGRRGPPPRSGKSRTRRNDDKPAQPQGPSYESKEEYRNFYQEKKDDEKVLCIADDEFAQEKIDICSLTQHQTE